jgi:hypothetical protein
MRLVVQEDLSLALPLVLFTHTSLLIEADNAAPHCSFAQLLGIQATSARMLGPHQGQPESSSSSPKEEQL